MYYFCCDRIIQSITAAGQELRSQYPALSSTQCFPTVRIEPQYQLDRGDFTSAYCLKLAGFFREKPEQIIEKLLPYLQKYLRRELETGLVWFEQGFINIKVKDHQQIALNPSPFGGLVEAAENTLLDVHYASVAQLERIPQPLAQVRILAHAVLEAFIRCKQGLKGCVVISQRSFFYTLQQDCKGLIKFFRDILEDITQGNLRDTADFAHMKGTLWCMEGIVPKASVSMQIQFLRKHKVNLIEWNTDLVSIVKDWDDASILNLLCYLSTSVEGDGLDSEVPRLVERANFRAYLKSLVERVQPLAGSFEDALQKGVEIDLSLVDGLLRRLLVRSLQVSSWLEAIAWKADLMQAFQAFEDLSFLMSRYWNEPSRRRLIESRELPGAEAAALHIAFHNIKVLAELFEMPFY